MLSRWDSEYDKWLVSTTHMPSVISWQMICSLYMQGVVLLVLPCQTLFSAWQLGKYHRWQPHSFKVCLGWSIETFEDRFTAVLPGYGPEPGDSNMILPITF